MPTAALQCQAKSWPVLPSALQAWARLAPAICAMLAGHMAPALALVPRPCQAVARPLHPALAVPCGSQRGASLVVAGDKGKDLSRQVAAAQQVRAGFGAWPEVSDFALTGA